jgi:hypothetical protein
MFGKQLLLFWPPFPLLYVWEVVAIFWPTLLSSPLLSLLPMMKLSNSRNYQEYELMIMNL